MKVSKIIGLCKEILSTADVSIDLSQQAGEFVQTKAEDNLPSADSNYAEAFNNEADREAGKEEQNEELAQQKVSQTDEELLTCCNFVLQELYCDYSMSVRKTVVEVTDSFCDTTSLRLNKVISLCDAEGTKIPFRYTEKGLFVERDGAYNLTYGVMPNEVTYFDEITMPSPVICERTLVYGILREYFTRIGDYVSANVWHEKYQNALRVASVKRSGQYMHRRRWL